MSKEIELGELSFTGQDIFKAMKKAETTVIPGSTDSCDALASEINFILRERLEKALEVYGQRTIKHDGWKMDWKFRKEPWHTHRARLVAIESRGD